MTLFDYRPAEIALLEENPNLTEPGLTLQGFVERSRGPGSVGGGRRDEAPRRDGNGRRARHDSVHSRQWDTGHLAYWSDSQFAALCEAWVT
ncbi:hypothetical protein [Mycobacterium uberis]|uniref:hypothetical protein n=1 Tax=Mycobacterium uberis TaxID=2162698 RepID=UPI000E308C37|nr:hypothetical protein [Mycobacterium uberis]